MIKTPILVPFGKTPEVVKTRPIPPDRITKKGLVLHRKNPTIAEVEITVPGAVGEAIEALEEIGGDGEVPMSLVMSWLRYIEATSEFLDR